MHECYKTNKDVKKKKLNIDKAHREMFVESMNAKKG